MPIDDHHFTLRRYKIGCCAADAVPLNAVIMADPKAKEPLPSGCLQGKWVQAIGRVQFLPSAGGGGYTTTLILPSDRPLSEVLKEVPPPANPYLELTQGRVEMPLPANPSTGYCGPRSRLPPALIGSNCGKDGADALRQPCLPCVSYDASRFRRGRRGDVDSGGVARRHRRYDDGL